MIKLKQLLSRNREQTLFECRHCGTNMETNTKSCPECDSDDITRYEL
ncbi:hypothetical protein SAMN04515672_3529 [Natronorubrum texcoconense]|uniref:Zinc-ribbon domain-containing protein n=1 Tax=Natronorubrum texcoconense TaxID=1095776 RepID=A0A1G9DD33_9EURY|nr:hypothetical protein SAMN04515672_3529 [Natronorubrum texcoconense]